MAQTFAYRAIRPDGQEVPGTIGSSNESAAIAELAAKGLQVFQIAPDGELSGEPWYRRDIQLFGAQVSARDLEQAASQLALLLESGVPLPKALNFTAGNLSNKRMATELVDIARAVEGGEDTAAAFARSDIFPELFRLYVEVGVRANNLPETLTRSAEYFDTLDRNRRDTATQLIYPGILIAAAIGLVAFLSSFVAPNLVPLFESAERVAPLALRILTALDPRLVVGIPIVCALVTSVIVWLPAPSRARILATGRSFLPRALSAGSPDWQFAVSARSLSHLLAAGVPLHRALSAIAGSATDPAHRDVLRAAEEAVTTGSSAAAALEATGAAPPIFVTLFAAGETANSLPQTMGTAARLLQAQAQQRASRVRTLLTPAITIGVALLIGAMVFAIMQAILELGTLAY